MHDRLTLLSSITISMGYQSPSTSRPGHFVLLLSLTTLSSHTLQTHLSLPLLRLHATSGPSRMRFKWVGQSDRGYDCRLVTMRTVSWVLFLFLWRWPSLRHHLLLLFFAGVVLTTQ